MRLSANTNASATVEKCLYELLFQCLYTVTVMSESVCM